MCRKMAKHICISSFKEIGSLPVSIVQFDDCEAVYVSSKKISEGPHRYSVAPQSASEAEFCKSFALWIALQQNLTDELIFTTHT